MTCVQTPILGDTIFPTLFYSQGKTDPLLKLDEGKEDRIGPRAPTFGQNFGNLRIYTLHTNPRFSESKPQFIAKMKFNHFWTGCGHSNRPTGHTMP